MEMFLSILIGLGLSAACGFRVFIPLLVMSLASRSDVGHLTLGDGFAWIGSDAALIAFGAATVLEIAGYYIPWVDNLLDAVIGLPANLFFGTGIGIGSSIGRQPSAPVGIRSCSPSGASAAIPAACSIRLRVRTLPICASGSRPNPTTASSFRPRCCLHRSISSSARSAAPDASFSPEKRTGPLPRGFPLRWLATSPERGVLR